LLVEGDVNSKYFYKMVLFKQRHESTMSIESGGGRVEKVEGVCDMVFQTF